MEKMVVQKAACSGQQAGDSGKPVELGTNYLHHILFCADLVRWYLEPQNIEQGITNVEGEQNI